MRSIIRNHDLFSIFFLILSFLMLTNYSFAETKTFIKEYTFQAGDEDSKNSSRVISLREVKRLLLEELGTYLESTTEVQNFKLTKDQVVTLTAGIVQTEIVEDKWDGKTYWLKAKIVADSEGVINAIDTLRQDRQKTKELEETRKRSEELLKENARLRKEFRLAKGNKKDKNTTAYKKTINELSAMEWFENGTSDLKASKYSDAITAYSKAIVLNVKLSDAYANRGIAYSMLGQNREAIIDYNKAIDLTLKDANDSAWIYINRGVSYNHLGDYKNAIDDYDNAIRLNSKMVGAYYNRGLTYRDIGSHKQAIGDFNKAIEINASYEDAYSARGIAYQNFSEYQKAIDDYNKAIELNPINHKTYNNRGNSYKKIKNYKQAISDYDKSIEINPKVAEVYGNRGITYRTIGNYRQAISDFEKAIELAPKEAWTYYNRGITYFILENDKQRDADLRVAARLGHKEAQEVLKTIGVDW